MLSITWLIVTGLIAWAHAQGSPINCPEFCECGVDSNKAKCSTLGKEQFPSRILYLTIQPKDLNEQLMIIEDDAFVNVGLQYLNALVIKHVTIESISPNAFRGLDHLATVVLDHCKLENVPRELFKNLSLVQLSLANNPLKKVQFDTRIPIEELNLANCKIELTKDMFVNVSQLQYLNLASNEISTLNKSVFSSLENLSTLDLSNNNIEEISPTLFENMEDLSILNMSNNPITSFYLKDQALSDDLILKSCDISRIESKFGDYLINLSNLDLSDNAIEEIEQGAFSKMENLQYIDLSANSLTNRLDADVFAYNMNLEKIFLNDNSDLKILPVFQTKEVFVTYIFQCNNCGLTELHDDTFSAMPALASLHLANNMLQEVNSAVFRTLSGLSILDLSHNALTNIDVDTFSKNPNLMTLNLAGNPLKVIGSNIFHSNLALKTLDISSCKLSHLWDRSAMEPMPSLQILNAANNNITVVTQSDLSLANNLKALDITKNKLICNQDFTDVINWLIEHGVTPSSSSKEEYVKSGIDFELNSRNDGWRQIEETMCLDNFEDSSYNSNENYENSATSRNEPNMLDDDDDDEDEDDDYTDEEIIEEDLDENILPIMRIPRKSMYSYMWPILVFLFTALLVLVIVANFIMLILKHRGRIDGPTNILPHIKIQPWSTGNKMKKHSGSVYKQLSEDISGPRTPMINRYTQLQCPAVHNPSNV